MKSIVGLFSSTIHSQDNRVCFVMTVVEK